jgi:hypothetical protein
MSAPVDSGVSTARTPGILAARLASTFFTRACACGHRSTAAWSMPGSDTSDG